MRIVAVGSPKGGVGKTTTAVTVSAVAAQLGLRVLLVDADRNRSSLDWAESIESYPVEVADGRDPGILRRLRELGTSQDVDLVVVDLPGARVGAFEDVLAGDGRPVADLLVTPTEPEVLDLRPVIRVVQDEVLPLGLAHLLVFTKVPTARLPRAHANREYLRALGLNVASTVIRQYSVYRAAVEVPGTILDVPGTSTPARNAQDDYTALTTEILAAVGITAPTTKEATGGQE